MFLSKRSNGIYYIYYDDPITKKSRINPQAKLTEQIVMEIKQRSDESTSLLAKEYGVSPSTIADIKAGRRWKHIAA